MTCLEIDNNEVRLEELDSIQAIFPEAQISRQTYTGTIDIAIELDQEIAVTADIEGSQTVFLKSFPSVLFEFHLPDEYPEMCGPQVTIDSTWVPKRIISKLRQSLQDTWEATRDCVIYIMIDTVQSEVLEYLNNLENRRLVMGSATILDQMLTFDHNKDLEAFNQMTFTCDICQDDKKGSFCAQLPKCSHVFCIDCLKGYFTENLQAGEASKIHCPDYNCTKKALEAESELLGGNMSQNMSFRRFEIWQKDLFTLPLPVQFLKQLVGEEPVEQFKALFEAQRFRMLQKEYPAKVVTCSRKSCGHTFIDQNDEDTLAICPTCNFAFCRDCRRSWHGTMNTCKPISAIPVLDMEKWIESTDGSKQRYELSARYGRRNMNIAVNAYLSDKALQELIADGTSDIQSCPNCEVLIRRSDGCNKMRCSKCNTLFCNICGDSLDPEDPYLHFRSPQSTCCGKLFDGLIQE